MDITLTTVLFFRTLPNGAYRYMRGLRRGYWRLQDVQCEHGSHAIHSHNVICVRATTAEGIDGVTPRSRYYRSTESLEQRARELNRARDEQWNAQVHRGA